MGKIISIFLLFLFSSASIKSQSIKHNLLSAHSFYYNYTVFVYGYEQQKDQLIFKCYSYTNGLVLKDSTELVLGTHQVSDYLEISTDTLHDVINFYFQLADQKNKVTLLRLNASLQKICSIENFDANHVNSLAVFDDEKYVVHQNLYTVRTTTDTSGKQFYLSKYTVKAMDKPFEYEFNWQYACEKKYVHRLSIVYADKKEVILYASAYDGLKKGQWIVRINANTGEVIRGTRLSPKGDNRLFLFSKLIYDTLTKSIDVIGSIYPANMIDLKQHTSNFTNLSALHQLFLINIDSAGEAVSRIEKAFPLPPPKKIGSTFTSFHLKFTNFTKQKDGSFTIWTDLYEQAFPNILVYYSSWYFVMTPTEENYTIKTLPFYVATKPLLNFMSFAKGDSYGKFNLNDAGDYDLFKYKTPTNSVVVKTGLDSVNNQYFILKKTDLLSGKRSFNYMFPGKKDIEKKILITSEKGQATDLYFIDKRRYISFITNVENTEYELKLNTF